MLSWVGPAIYLIAFGILVGAGAIVWFLITHSRWRGSVDTDRTNFREFMEEIRRKIDQIFSRLDRLTPVSAGQSPIRLTDLGKTISQELDASAWAGRLAVPLNKHLAGKDAYEVQVFCFDHVEQVEYSDEEQRTIGRGADNHGIDTWEVRRVLAIELRDKLLAIAGLAAP